MLGEIPTSFVDLRYAMQPRTKVPSPLAWNRQSDYPLPGYLQEMVGDIQPWLNEWQFFKLDGVTLKADIFNTNEPTRLRAYFEFAAAKSPRRRMVTGQVDVTDLMLEDAHGRLHLSVLNGREANVSVDQIGQVTDLKHALYRFPVPYYLDERYPATVLVKKYPESPIVDPTKLTVRVDMRDLGDYAELQEIRYRDLSERFRERFPAPPVPVYEG